MVVRGWHDLDEKWRENEKEMGKNGEEYRGKRCLGEEKMRKNEERKKESDYMTVGKEKKNP